MCSTIGSATMSSMLTTCERADLPALVGLAVVAQQM